MVSGLNLHRTEGQIVDDGIVKLNVIVTRDFDGMKHSVIFLDRDWFEKGSSFVTEWGIELEILKKFKRISESETCYILTSKSSWSLLLEAGTCLTYLGNVNHLYTNLQKLQEEPTNSLAEDLYNQWSANKKSATTYSLTVFDNTRSSKLVNAIEDLPDTRHKEPNPAYYAEVEPELLYSEEDLVPRQFFGLNDYLKCGLQI